MIDLINPRGDNWGIKGGHILDLSVLTLHEISLRLTLLPSPTPCTWCLTSMWLCTVALCFSHELLVVGDSIVVFKSPVIRGFSKGDFINQCKTVPKESRTQTFHNLITLRQILFSSMLTTMYRSFLDETVRQNKNATMPLQPQ